MSSLVEPLVAPLVTPLVGGRGRRTGAVRSRLAASALMMSAVMAVATGAAPDPQPASSPQPTVERNAHRPPAPVPLRDVPRVFGKAKAILTDGPRLGIERPGLAPRFEWDAIYASRLRHATNQSLSGRFGLGRGRSSDRLGRSRPPTYRLFGSGEHRSGSSAPIRV